MGAGRRASWLLAKSWSRMARSFSAFRAAAQPPLPSASVTIQVVSPQPLSRSHTSTGLPFWPRLPAPEGPCSQPADLLPLFTQPWLPTNWLFPSPHPCGHLPCLPRLVLLPEGTPFLLHEPKSYPLQLLLMPSCQEVLPDSTPRWPGRGLHAPLTILGFPFLRPCGLQTSSCPFQEGRWRVAVSLRRVHG